MSITLPFIYSTCLMSLVSFPITLFSVPLPPSNAVRCCVYTKSYPKAAPPMYGALVAQSNPRFILSLNFQIPSPL